MEAREELLAIAEIAVALIGFSGLIFVFRARDVTQLETRDLSALAIILGGGGLALSFALLPLPLAYVGLAELAFWRVASACFGGALLAAAVAFQVVNLRLSRSGHPERTPRLNRTTVLAMGVAGALLVASAAGALGAGPALYLLGLILCLLLALAFVVFLLVVARRAGSR